MSIESLSIYFQSINVYFLPSRHHYEKLPWTLVPMQPVVDEPLAAPIDPGIPQRSFTEKDFEGKTTMINDFEKARF